MFQKQTRRIYEILRLKATNCNELKEYTAYRIDIKRRLNLPFQVNEHPVTLTFPGSLIVIDLYCYCVTRQELREHGFKSYAVVSNIGQVHSTLL